MIDLLGGFSVIGLKLGSWSLYGRLRRAVALSSTASLPLATRPRAAWPPCVQGLVSEGTIRTDGAEAVPTERWVLENVCRFVALTFTAGNGTP